MSYKQWLDNEYQLWVEALQQSTVDNFREHPQVKRMLGEIDRKPYESKIGSISYESVVRLLQIQNIGYNYQMSGFTGAFIRMIYWALEVLKQNPKSICEIGGGVGEFYAIIRVLGYEGDYYIYDLHEVKEFQMKFLSEVTILTGLKFHTIENFGFCVSFYALGEFDDNLKHWYIRNVVNKCDHGLIVWNPHSGASHEINIDHELTIEDLQDGTSKITW